MPIKIPNELPAVRVLEDENIFVMTEKRAMTQDIRPLKILLLNLMPIKIDTETQFSRLLGNTPLQVELELIHTKSHKSKNTSEEHLLSFYKCFDEIKHKKYDLAIRAIKARYVDQKSFSEKLEDIYYAGAASNFDRALTQVKESPDNPTWNLLALSMKTSYDPNFLPDLSVLEAAPTVKNVYEQAYFLLVLKAFLRGCIEKDTDDGVLISYSDEYCAEIKAGKAEKDQAIFMARMAALLGKYYWVDDPQSPMFEGYAEWLLSASLQRPIDYSQARRFLQYTLLNSKAAHTLGRSKSFIDALRICLFDIGLLGMFYKTYILDFLVKHNRCDLVKEYIDTLYGVNCSKISLEEYKADMHQLFRPYGELVSPKLMQQFTEQLKWDVVGYLGHKEYALYAPLDCFEIIVNNDPSRWEDLGAQLYEQSEIADMFSNQAAHKIKNCITEAATVC